MIVVDLETTGLDPHNDTILGYGINGYYEIDNGWAFTLLQGKKITCHNGSFDIKFLWANGIEVELEFDTMIAAYCLPNRPESLSLGACAEFYLGESAEWKSTLKKTKAQDLDYETLKTYCLKDVEITKRLRVKLEQALKDEGLYEFFTKLMKVRNLLSRAEYNGMNVDWNQLNWVSNNLQGEVSNIKQFLDIEEKELIYEWQKQELQKKAQKLKTEKGRERVLKGPLPEFNWSSPSQVLYALKKIGADPLRYDFKEKGFKESSSTEVLKNNAHLGRFTSPLIKLRGAEKTLGMLEGYKALKNQKTLKLHGNLNITVTSTGRLSSSNPNLQNIDSGPTVRSLFIPNPGKIYAIGDMAQIEVRVAAHYSRDPKLIEMFKKEEDFYGTIACEVLKTQCSPNEVKSLYPNDRAVAKVIGLSILYGTGSKRLQSAIKQQAGISYTQDECKEIIKAYFRKFEGLKELQNRIEVAILNKGHLTNLFGRKLYIKPEDIYMHGSNYLMQSTASDLLLFRQLEMDDNKSSLVNVIHDEAIRECDPSVAEEVKEEMVKIMERTDDLNFRVPLKMEAVITNSWAGKK